MRKLITLTTCVFSLVSANAFAEDMANEEDFNNYVYDDEQPEYSNYNDEDYNYTETYDDDIEYSDSDFSEDQ